MNEIMIKVNELFFNYKEIETGKEIPALSGVSLDVKKGEFVCIIGHNGSGKSTLAKLLNAILLPSKGDIEICGMNTKDNDNLWNIRQKAGMVFQNPDNQMVATVVEEDVAFGPENLGVKPEEIRKRVDESLEKVNMLEFKDKQPHNLSGGQKQRVAIAGILAMEPECIILDEPTAMLDPKGRREVLKTVSKLNKENKATIILITHYMDEIINADKVFVMEKGKIALQGTPRDIFYNVEKLRELSLDVPLAAALSHDLQNEGLNINQALSLDELVEGLCQLK